MNILLMGLTQILEYSLTLPFDQMPQFFTYVDTQNIYTQLPSPFFFFFVSHSSINITTDKDTQYDHRHNQLFLIKNHACSYGYVTTSVSGRDFWRFRSRLFRIRGRTNWVADRGHVPRSAYLWAHYNRTCN